MSAKIFHIQNKNRTPASLIANLQDFSYEFRETIEPTNILEYSNISLYCLDHENRQAIFVETPLDIDIYEPPFLYQAQYEYAQRLIAVPYEEFHKLAQEIKNSIGQIVMIYSVGRSGSTLLSKIFNQLYTILSLSEPDVFSQIVSFRNSDGSNDREIEELVKSCICLLAKSNVNGKESFCAIKPRSFGIELADLIYRIWPEAKLIFIYRNAEDVVKSSIRAFAYFSKILPMIEQNIEMYSKFIPLLKENAKHIDFKDDKAIGFYTVMWLSVIHRYLLLYESGISMSALRYENLLSDPKQIITSIFNYCDLPESEISNACLAMEKDSQSGSNLSRENTHKNETNIPDILEIRQKVNDILGKHQKIKTADFIVPNTLKIY